MFKIGDKVKCINQPLAHQYQFKDLHNCIGKVYKVERIEQGSNACVSLKDEHGWFSMNLFVISKECLTEIDYLDAFQQNFKEGV